MLVLQRYISMVCASLQLKFTFTSYTLTSQPFQPSRQSTALLESVGANQHWCWRYRSQYTCTLITPYFKGTARDTNPMYLVCMHTSQLYPVVHSSELVVPGGTLMQSQLYLVVHSHARVTRASYAAFTLPLETVPARYQHGRLGTISGGSVNMTKACQQRAVPSRAVPCWPRAHNFLLIPCSHQPY